MARSVVEITGEPIDVGRLIAAASDPAAGGIAVFIGATRTPSGGREVRHLEYEAYVPMAVREMTGIVEKAAERWELAGACAVHRVGTVGVGEPSVVIVASSVHRGAAFEACRFIIDAVKKDAPIWKKEVYAEGHEWAGG